jgi:dipeptidyl aminopeptidase/acylaminoacyl peptidase
MRKTLLSLLLSAFSLTFYGQSEGSGNFKVPPETILKLADYDRPPSVFFDSGKKYLILAYRNTYKTLPELYQEELKLGGLRINPDHNISSTITYYNNLKIKKFMDKQEVQVKGLPENPKITYFAFSPDEKKLGFTHTSDKGVELWYLDLESGEAKQLTGPVLNANIGNPYSWNASSNELLVRTLPSNRQPLKIRGKEIPDRPVVAESSGEKSQNRTYQDLLKNPTDEFNFETLVGSEIKKVSLSGEIKSFLPLDLYLEEEISPDGKYILITSIEKPFSYIVPYQRFPQKISLYDYSGNFLTTLARIPLSENIPKGFMATRTGKRSLQWRNDMPATLFYVEALDEGDPAKKSSHRDALYLLEAPFKSEPIEFFRTKNRFSSILWGNKDFCLISDYWHDTRMTSTWKVNPGSQKDEPKMLWERNNQDIYAHPGDFETEKNKFGKSVVAVRGNKAFLKGEGHKPDGQFPFIDEFDLTKLSTRRLYVSKLKDRMESIIGFSDINSGEILVQIQSKSEFPNYFLRKIKGGNPVQITFNKNPFESIKNVQKEVIKYKRKDGVELSGTLYLPLGYDKTKKTKYPLLIWAYPLEYKDKNTAGQSRSNPNAFTFPHNGSFIYWVTRGYVVLDNASFPIVGEGDKEPNDTFIQQLIDNAEAAINAVDKMGYIDPKRVAIGGHSYGAFMTANLLTHSKLFACGIARSGAYNRTLTPFGFQGEQRNYWDAKEVYNGMSPFMSAEKMKTPLLLVHGEADNNPGTFTLQTERYYQALKGLGAHVKMVILPGESHGYAAKENILHLLWEQDTFLEKHLK